MRALMKLKPYLRPHLGLLLLSTALAIPLGALRMGPAPLVKSMLDDLFIKKDPHQLILLPLSLIGLYCLNFLIRFGHYFALRVVIIRVNQRLKNKIFEHLLGLSADYFSRESTGTLISRTASDPQSIDSGLSCINIVIREPITLLFLFGYTLHTNWKLTLITMILTPCLAWVFSATGRNLKRYLKRLFEINATLFSTLQEGFTGIRIIKLFRLENYVRSQFEQKNQDYAQFLIKTSLLEEIAHPLVELLTAFALAPIIYYGGRQVFVGKMTPGDLFGFFTAFALMMNPIRMLNDVNMKLHQMAQASERIFEIFEWKSNLREAKNPKPISDLKTGIELKNVSFAYPDQPSRRVLKNVSFQIPKGKAIALVGPSGSGKSSLAHLLPRIFDPTDGQILIDDQDIRGLKLEDLQKMIAVVSQDVFLFNDTIEENIRCGKLGATKEEIQEAARKAHALEFIENLPQGFQTQIGERGQKLSGGEKQRISIARAFLKAAPILVLDEATSSLDNQSERAVQRALDELMENRTSLMIAHRLSTIQNAHTIFVIREGEIIEQGNHDTLLEKQGVYAQFHHGV
ncbi:MAG: ABC transporter ATP-binding protein [Bdellovibrionia bacterium]